MLADVDLQINKQAGKCPQHLPQHELMYMHTECQACARVVLVHQAGLHHCPKLPRNHIFVEAKGLLICEAEGIL